MTALKTAPPPSADRNISAPEEAHRLGAPWIIVAAGEDIGQLFREFFRIASGQLATRAARYRVARSFFSWVERQGVARLGDIELLHVATYLEMLETAARGTAGAKPKEEVKLHLTAIRELFDWLTAAGALAANPARAVRGPQHVVRRRNRDVGPTQQARRELLETIDAVTLAGRRDRALVGMLVYSYAPVEAIVGMRVDDYQLRGKRRWLSFRDKDGRRRELPAPPRLEALVDAYLAASATGEDGTGPLFRKFDAKPGRPRQHCKPQGSAAVARLAPKPMTRSDVYRMLTKRRAG